MKRFILAAATLVGLALGQGQALASCDNAFKVEERSRKLSVDLQDFYVHLRDHFNREGLESKVLNMRQDVDRLKDKADDPGVSCSALSERFEPVKRDYNELDRIVHRVTNTDRHSLEKWNEIQIRFADLRKVIM